MFLEVGHLICIVDYENRRLCKKMIQGERLQLDSVSYMHPMRVILLCSEFPPLMCLMSLIRYLSNVFDMLLASCRLMITYSL